jgi:hypothetical protein
MDDNNKTIVTSTPRHIDTDLSHARSSRQKRDSLPPSPRLRRGRQVRQERQEVLLVFTDH